MVADADALLSVFGNLLANAIRYTPAGGCITVHCGADDGEAWTTISDTGIGMAPEIQERIFEKFYRAREARDVEAQGLGLGLSLVQELVQAHGGRVEVQSAPGEGSTFRVVLPAGRCRRWRGESMSAPGSEAVEQTALQDTIAQQRATISELQTPVIQVWEGILALPIVGTVDTARAQDMTEALLERIVATGSEIVLLDITGVPVVDTAVARHLLETVTAARLLGADVLIVGLSSRTAMTLVQLGIDLSHVTTRATLAKGLEFAFRRLGLVVVAQNGSTRRTVEADGATP